MIARASTPRALRTLLGRSIDYAGLFPPASLDLDATLAAYARYRTGPHAWLLGRLVLPAARLDEAAAHEAVPGDAAAHDARAAWPVSAVVGDDVDAAFAAAAAYRGGERGLRVEALEVRAGDAAAIEAIARRAAAEPPGWEIYVEIPADPDPRPLLDALAAHRLRAKIRTGGTTPEAIPSVEHVARFLLACYARDLPMKATAGLHHALPGEHALTYAPDAPRARTHGFLALFLAAALCYNGLTRTDAPRRLALDSLEGVTIDDEAVAWASYRTSADEIARVRRRLLVSFGSCSFEEPVADLVALGLVPGA